MDIQSLKEIVKGVALYIMPIVSVIFSGIALWKTRKVSKMEDKIREYDAFIKKAEVDKIKAEQMRIPKAQIDARVTKISANKHKIYVYNKGDAIAYNVDYELEEGSCVSKIGNNMTPL